MEDYRISYVFAMHNGITAPKLMPMCYVHNLLTVFILKHKWQINPAVSSVTENL